MTEHRVQVPLAERAERIATYAYKAPDRAALVEYARLEIGSAVIEADADCQGAAEAIRTLLEHADRGTDDTWLVRHSDVERLRALTNPGGLSGAGGRSAEDAS